jgi:ribosomal-protein-serine acetyltransferase
MVPNRVMPERLVGERIIVRRSRPADAEAWDVAITASIEHLRGHMPWIAEEPKTIEQRRALLDEWDKAWKPGRGYNFMIFLHGDEHTVVGGCGLYPRGVPSSLEIGYWVHVDHAGQGIATEASRLLTTAAFSLEHISSVTLHHDRANVRSRRVPEKLGFRKGRSRRSNVSAPNDDGVDVAWYIRRNQWPAARSA